MKANLGLLFKVCMPQNPDAEPCMVIEHGMKKVIFLRPRMV